MSWIERLQDEVERLEVENKELTERLATTGSRLAESELERNHLRLLKDAYERSGMVTSPCIRCGEQVVCMRNERPWCIPCVEEFSNE